MAKINTLNFKLKAMRQLHYNSLLFSETGSRDHRHKQRKQAKIKIPIIQSPYGQCYTDRNYYDHNQNKVHSREVRCHSNPFY